MNCLPYVILLAVTADTVFSAAVVRLTQETPCLSAQSCRLKCSVVSGTNDNGLYLRRRTLIVVSCPGGRDSCRSEFPHLYTHTQVDYSTSYVDIRSFDASVDATYWICGDGIAGTLSILAVIQNVLPTGSLTYGSTCVSGRATSPVSLFCFGLSPGVPPATLSIVDSNNDSAGSSQTGIVTGEVTRGGHASCFVTWSAFPSYSFTISPALCYVQVAANVTISVRDTTGQDKVITCQAEGHPGTYTFQPWLQSWERQEVRRVTGSQQGGQYSLTLTSYQDTGIYTCAVDNGVLDSSGQVIRRTANVNVTVENSPVLLLSSDPPIVAGEDGEPARLFRSLYAFPDLVNHTWFFNSTDVTSLIPGATTNRSRDMVLLPVHGTTVTTEGTVINLYLTVSQKYSGLYRLLACNRIGCTSANISLVAISAPFAPESLAAKPSTDSVELSWTPGFAGGDFFQWFHVQYRRQDCQEGQWSNVSSADNRSSSDRTPVTVTVQGLQPDTSYVFRVRAQSSRPQRHLSNYTLVFVKTDPKVLYSGSTLAAAVVVTALLSAAATLAAVDIVKRLRQNASVRRQRASTVYQNVGFSHHDMSENVGPATGRTQPVAENSQNSGAEGAYSVLDPVSRDKPRDPALYQHLAQPGLHGNQVHSNSPAEGQYATPYELTR